ncbi:MAG: tetratricopeptide repeat protein [Streptosporangiaceae bacterium]
MSTIGGRRRAGPAAVPTAPVVSWPVWSGSAPAVTDYFSPRQETGFGLDANPGDLARRAGDGPHPLTLLVGPNGHGKTYLAAAVLRGAARSGQSDLQVWVNASSPSAVVMGYARAATDVGIADRATPPDAAASRFLDWLGRTERPWMMVLDNVTDSAGLRGLWPAGAAGQVIVTCHPSADMSEVADSAPRICRISEFSPREALSYLTARLYDDAGKRVEAVDLAADLGYMPLALGLAATTVAGTGLDCRQYRIRFAGRRQELLGRAADGSVSPAEVAWSLALDRADQLPPAGLARPLLAFVALLDPAGMPVQVAASRAAFGYLARHGRGMPVDQKEVMAALGALAHSGLVAIDRTVGVGLIAVHPLVQDTVRRLVPAAVLDDAARSAADAIVEVWPALESDPAQEQALRGCAGWLGGIAGDLLWLPEPHPVLITAGNSLTAAGLGGAAVAYWKSMLAASGRALGPEHLRTLAMRDLLASACESAGRMDESRELALISVAEREQVQGPDHPDTLTARTALARIYAEAGMFDAAIDAYGRVLADREWVLGPEHADTLGVRSQLAGTYLQAGQPDQAIALYQRNLADWEQSLGPEHADVLAEYLNVASAYQRAGRLDEAIAIFARVRKIRESSLGPDHPDTLTAAALLALAYKSGGRLKDAITLYRQVLASREAALGPDHPDTLTAMANLASCYHTAHRMKDAIPLYEQLLAGRERTQGPDHRDTMTARGNLAGAYHSAGRLSDALPVYERTVAEFERVLGPDHPDTLTSRANLAHAYYMARRLSDALRLFQRTITDADRALGPDHPLTQAISDNLRTITRLGQPAGAARSHNVNRKYRPVLV